MTSTSVMGGIVRRKEDPSLIQGKGAYVDDVKRTGELAAVFVRSPFAAATITSIDIEAAKAAPVYTPSTPQTMSGTSDRILHRLPSARFVLSWLTERSNMSVKRWRWWLPRTDISHKTPPTSSLSITNPVR